MLPQTPERQRSIDGLHRRIDSIRGDIYRSLTPWQRVLVARHPNRPTVLDYVNRLFTEFTEISGDRRFADDHAMVAGFARYKDEPVLVVGHHKGGGGDTKQKIFRNFGYAQARGLPQGAARDEAGGEVPPPGDRLHRHAGGVSRAWSPRSAASPRPSRSTCARWRRSTRRSSSSCTARAAAAARSGIAVGDRILMHEFAIYSVIPPEGCAAILWRDSGRKVEAADGAQADGARSAAASGIIDEIVPEPRGGAHTNHEQAATLLDMALERALAAVSAHGLARRASRPGTGSGARWATSGSTEG